MSKANWAFLVPGNEVEIFISLGKKAGFTLFTLLRIRGRGGTLVTEGMQKTKRGADKQGRESEWKEASN